jgi:hypothetical protein
LRTHLIDKLAEHDEPVTVFCVHDADAYGTMIHQTLQEATNARAARKIKIVNLGLDPWEAIAMGLEVETVEVTQNKDGEDKRKPVADYVLERDRTHPNEARGGTSWEEWLQTHRVELNAMTTPQLIEWLDMKMKVLGCGKLIPPAEVLEEDLAARAEKKVRAEITKRILREADLDAQVATAMAALQLPDGEALAHGIEQLFEAQPDAEWRAHIEAVAEERS